MAIVPDTHTFVNSVLDSSEENTYIRDPIRFLLNRPAALLRQTAVQNLASSGTFTAITFDTEDLDTDPSGTGGHSTSVNTSRYTAQYAGWYRVSGGIAFDTGSGQRGARWAVNGVEVNGSEIYISTSGSGGTVIAARTTDVFLNVGDYVELKGMQNTGGALNTLVTGVSQSTMAVEWIRNA